MVNGLINDCGKIVGDGKKKVGWFDISTLKDLQGEGKKTMGLELAEQMGWSLPDVIFWQIGVPALALKPLPIARAWLDQRKLAPHDRGSGNRLCLVKAFDDGEERAHLWQDAHRCSAFGCRLLLVIS